MSNAIFLGLDLGTTGCRAIAIDEANTLVAQQAVALPTPVQTGKTVEQDAEIWWQAVTEVLSQLFTVIDAKQVKAISIDATSGTVLLCDHKGQPLYPALMYNDTRAHQQANQIQTIAPAAATAASAANSGLAKLLWLQKQTFSNHAHYLLHQADWITGKLSAHFGFSDFNNCLKSGYDVQHQCWPDWLDALGVKRNWLPEVRPPGSPLRAVSPEIAQAFKLNTDCLLVAGTTDSTAAFLASGANKTGEAVTALGSTLALKIICEQPITAAEFGIYSQPLPELTPLANAPLRWLCGGASNSGGAVLRQYFSDAQMTQMQRQIDPAAPTGLDYYPLPAKGERFPVNDPELEARLTPRPENDLTFFQGILEGLSRIEKDGYDKLQQLGAATPTRIYTSGGGSHNPAWRQMRQQQMAIPVIIAAQTEAAYGAALLAKRGWQQQA